MELNHIDEAKQIISGLEKTDDYLGAERVVLTQIKMYNNRGISIPVIEKNLALLLQYFQNQMRMSINPAQSVKYLYVTSFLDRLLHSTYWHSWINSSKI